MQASKSSVNYLFKATTVLLTRVPQWCHLKAWGSGRFTASQISSASTALFLLRFT